MFVQPPVQSLRHLVEIMDAEGYDWDPEYREFTPRADGPAAGHLVIGIRPALEGYDPDRYLDRSDELRDPPLPPVHWPHWA